MPTHLCPRCGKEFADKSNYNRHLGRKTPCAPILDKEDLPEEKRNSPNRCRFCGRVFTRHSDMVVHMRTTCKIAPREGNPDGMERLYAHTLKKQMAAMQAELSALKAQVQAPAPGSALVVARSSAEGGSPARIIPTASANTQIGHVGTLNATLNTTNNVDASVGKTINNVTINVFGKENLSRVTKPQVYDILRGLGPVGENIKAMAERAIIQAAMLIFSDPAHPEDITCYLPNKKGDNALVHGETGWEMQPIGLVISPMATKAIDALFAKQPAPDTTTPVNDVKWMMDECGRIMRYIAQHEGDLTNEPPKGEFRGVLIRNKDLLHQVLASLPLAGPTS